MSQEQASKQVVEQFLKTFSTGDVDAIRNAMSEDATWWIGGTLPISGSHDREAFMQLLGGIAEQCTGPIQLTPTGFTTEGAKVAVEADSFAETQNGRTYNNKYHFLFEVRGDKICSVKEYLDTMHTSAVFLEP